MINKVIIVTRGDSEALSELRWVTRNSPRIELFLGSFTEIPHYDCLATAGNSFGLMDAGIDLAVATWWI